MNLIERNPSRRIPVRKPEKSRIDLSHYIMGSGQIGYLMPIGWYEIVPGDSFQLSSNINIDYAPVLRPFMTRVDAYIHHFYIPNRLIMPMIGVAYAPWDKFIQGDPEDVYTTEILPYVEINDAAIAAGNFDVGSLADYLGLPQLIPEETTNQDVIINVLPALAYWLIVDEYYRNEWYMDRKCGPSAAWDITLSGGPVQADILEILPLEPYFVFYEMDYFGGSTPTAYKGSDSDVELDLDIMDIGGAFRLEKTTEAQPAIGSVDVLANRITQDQAPSNLHIPQDADGLLEEYIGVLEVMELRRTQALTRFLEAENRLGNDNYGDWLLSIFGVVNPDFRDSVPRYLGGGKVRTNVNSVVNPGDVLIPSSDAVGIPSGYQAGIAGIQGSSKSVGMNATEYGIAISLMSIVPRVAYANILDRYWTKEDRTEFYNPYFQNIGDQEIYEGERGFQVDGDNTDTWAYQQRWAEYKYKQSRITGEFAGNLDDFHMGFVHDVTGAPPTATEANFRVDHQGDENLRIFETQGTEHHLYYLIFNKMNMVRPMYLTDIPV